MPSIFVFLQLQSTCTGIVQDNLPELMTIFKEVAIYMHGYSASRYHINVLGLLLVAIYMHGYSASDSVLHCHVLAEVAIYMHGYSAS